MGGLGRKFDRVYVRYYVEIRRYGMPMKCRNENVFRVSFREGGGGGICSPLILFAPPGNLKLIPIDTGIVVVAHLKFFCPP